VLPGMQSAFVDLGLERDCFLYVSDFFEEHADEFDRVDDRGRDTRGRDRDRSREPRESLDASPVLALPPVANGERADIEFAPVTAVPALEEGIAPAAAVTNGAASGTVEGVGDAHRDRRGRRSRRRRRGSRGFPESKYASPADEAAAPAQSEADPEGEADVKAEEAREESGAPEVSTPPAEEFLLLPGDDLRIKVITEGKEAGQGVGYLDDGTMVVVEGGARLVGHELDVAVTRVLQTVMGRMVFAQAHTE